MADDMSDQRRRTLRELYRRLDQRGVAAVRNGEPEADSVPHDGSPRWGLSIVATIQGPTAEALEATAREFSHALGPDDIVHCEGSLHMTVRTLEHHRTAIRPGDALLERYAAVIDQACMAVPQFEIRFEGVVLTPCSIATPEGLGLCANWCSGRVGGAPSRIRFRSSPVSRSRPCGVCPRR